METKKEIVVVLTHADTDERIKHLEDCVDTLINQNKKILISSHIDIPNHLYSKVDYVIIDKENPILNDEVAPIFINHFYPEFRQTFTINFNHSFAVHKLILNACLMAQLNNFESIHFVNYDYYICDSSILEIHNNLLLENDVVSYDLSGNGTQHQLRMLSSPFFSINTRIINDTLLKFKTKNDFINYGVFIYEQFLYNIFIDYKIGFLDSNILKNCSINKVSTLSDYSFEVEDGTSIWCGISQQADEIFLYIRSNYERNILINGLEFKTKVEINLYAINEEILSNIIEIDFIDLKITKRHDINSRRAECAIFDRNIINYDLINNSNSFQKKSVQEISTDKHETIETLENIGLRNGCDKFLHHGYHFFYSSYFEKFRYDDFNLLEIGYGDGSSMRTWLDYFSKAKIFIVEKNARHLESLANTEKLFYSKLAISKVNDRAYVLNGDQSSEDDMDFIIDFTKKSKLIIDDGSHNPLHQINTFNYLFDKLLEPGGIYIIEDIELSYWHPDSTLYGYKTGHVNIIDHFIRYNHMVNSEFSQIRNMINISSISYFQNSIIITKRDENENSFFDRTYRFQNCINGINHF
jgi:hypothetical protein